MELPVTVLELPASWADPRSALARVEQHLASVPAGHLVLLPEASLTGYVSPKLEFDLSPMAEPLEGETSRALSDLARRHGVHLVGPLIERDGPRLYNSLIGFDPRGRRFLHYRKRHPWLPERWATPGDLPWPVVDVEGLSVTAALCFDLHFLADEAAEALGSADLLLFSSAWVEDEGDTRRPLLVGLARRFGLHVANANWGPGAVRMPGQGGSVILGPDGTVLAEVSEGRAVAAVHARSARIRSG